MKVETSDQHQAGDQSSKQAEAFVAIRVLWRPSLLGKPFEIPCEAEGGGVARIVQRIREDRYAVGPETPEYLQNGETEIEKEGDFKVAFAAVIVAGVGIGHGFMGSSPRFVPMPLPIHIPTGRNSAPRRR